MPPLLFPFYLQLLYYAGDSTNGGILKTPNSEPMEQLSAFISRITSQKEGVNYLSNEVATRYLRVKGG
jgi:hypothetical protein